MVKRFLLLVSLSFIMNVPVRAEVGSQVLHSACCDPEWELAVHLEKLKRKPNVLLIVMDDFGTGQFAPMVKDLELEDLDPGFLAYTDRLEEEFAYNKQAALKAAKRAMPFMDELAEEGILFSQAFAGSNLCSPARQAILTATSPARWGAYRNIDVNPVGLPQGSSLALIFQEAGYRTGFFGKWHLGSKDPKLKESVLAAGGSEQDLLDAGYLGSAKWDHHPFNHGFGDYFGYNLWECPYYDSNLIWNNFHHIGNKHKYNTDLFTDKAIGFMQRSIKEELPFLVELAYHSIHIPLTEKAPEPYQIFDTGSPPVDLLYSHIYGVDVSVRRIVDMLKAHGEWENTILFFTSDNGATCKAGDGDLSLIPGNGAFRGHKGQMFLGGIRVPLLMVWPKEIKDGQVLDPVVSVMDIMPTALAAADLPFPDRTDGKSLLPLLEDPDATIHEHLFFAGIHAAAWGYSDQQVIGHAQTRRNLSPGAWVMLDDENLLRFTGSLDAGLMKTEPEGRPAFYSLFNYKNDPLELNDLHDADLEKARELKSAFGAIAAQLCEPQSWDRKRWAELVPGVQRSRGKGLNTPPGRSTGL